LNPYGPEKAHNPEPMKIKLTPEISATVTKYAELTGHTPDEFLNRYLKDNMVALFENAR
jgi:hypothetical protein